MNLLGLLNYETSYVYVQEQEHYNAEIFLQFLKKVLTIYPTGQIAPVH